jgi:hypothetical protein
MRRFNRFFLVLVVLFSVAIVANAQQAKQNVFKASLMSPLVRTGSFFYERALDENKSAQLGFFYSGLSVGETKFRGFGITPEFRLYLSEKRQAPAGIFVAPYLRYQNFDLSDTGDIASATYSSLGGGLLIGSQRVLSNIISLEAFIGPSYSSGNVKVVSGNANFDTGYFDGFGVRFGVTIGLAL